MTNKAIPFFSVAIPVYEMSGKGVQFLDFSFQKLYTQTFKDFEVVVADHSKNEAIKELCQQWSDKLNLCYFKNDYKRGSSSANINKAMEKASGEWIKILFQDDFLYAENSLEKIYNHIKTHESIEWIASGCEHSKDGKTMQRPFYPQWTEDIHLGNNRISSPSVITLKNRMDKIYFDEALVWLMDVEFYKRMYLLYGEPSYIHDILVVNRIWGKSATKTISKKIKEAELDLIKKRYQQKPIMSTSPEEKFNALCTLQFDHSTLYGRGIVDINEHLPTLRKYASMCDHVTEMGTRFAISVQALLIAKPKKVVSIDINYHFFQPYEQEINDFAAQCGTPFQFIEGDVLKMDIEPTDLLFIDTLHTYNQLSQELRRHEKNVKKWIVAHDTVTFGKVDEKFYKNGQISQEVSNRKVKKKGLYTALMDFLEENKNWKIKEHFTNNNGLTVIERC